MKKLFIILLIPLLFVHLLIAGVHPVYAAMENESVTIFTPESLESEPVVEAVKVKPPKKGISKWWYVLLLAAAGGGAAAASSGGGGDSSGGGGGGGGRTGSVSASW